jgi:peptide chain release factor 1
LSLENLDPKEIASLGQHYSELGKVSSLIDNRDTIMNSLNELKSIEVNENENDDSSKEMVILVNEEREGYEKKLADVELEIIECLTPKSNDDKRNVVLEVRAGTGYLFFNFNVVYFKR